MPEKHERFPSGLQACLLILALVLTEYLIGTALYDMQSWLQLSPNQRDALVALLANGCIFSAVMHAKQLSYRTLFHEARSSPAAMVLLLPPIAMLLPVLVMGVSVVVGLVVQLAPLSAQEEAMFERMGTGNLASVLVTCVLAPVLEEMLFRGLILRSFLRQYPRGGAIVGSAVLFGVAHLNIYQFFAALALGCVAGWLYERTRSLIPCIALHASYNSTLVVLSWVARDGGTDPLESSVAGTWVLALLLGAGGTWALRRLLVARRR